MDGMARPVGARARRRRRAAALTLALAASAVVGAAGERATGPVIAGRQLLGWGDSTSDAARPGERRRCPDAVSAAIDSVLVGPRGEATRAAELLAKCQAITPFRLSVAALDARETRQVCAVATCVAWFVAVADAAVPECDYRGEVSVRSLSETYLRVCDDLGSSEAAKAPDADAFTQLYRLNVLLNLAGELHTVQDASRRPTAASSLVATARRRLQQSGDPDVAAFAELDSAGDDSGSGSASSSASASASASSSSSSSSSSGSDSSLHELGVGSAISGFEDSSSTTQSSASELAMSYLYICLILALFNCSYLFFMRKT